MEDISVRCPALASYLQMNFDGGNLGRFSIDLSFIYGFVILWLLQKYRVTLRMR